MVMLLILLMIAYKGIAFDLYGFGSKFRLVGDPIYPGETKIYSIYRNEKSHSLQGAHFSDCKKIFTEFGQPMYRTFKKGFVKESFHEFRMFNKERSFFIYESRIEQKRKITLIRFLSYECRYDS